MSLASVNSRLVYFVVLAHPGSPRQRPLRECMLMSVALIRLYQFLLCVVGDVIRIHSHTEIFKTLQVV